MKLFKFKLVLSIVSVLLLLSIVSEVRSQAVYITGREADFGIIYDDTLAAAVTKALLQSVGHSGWFHTGDYQFFFSWITFDTTGFSAGIGLTSVDTVEILMEQYSSLTKPTSSSTSFLEWEAPGTVPAREIIATYDSTLIVANPNTFISFHGSGDPEMAPGTYVRFYVRVVNGFTGAGLGFKLGLFKQP